MKKLIIKIVTLVLVMCTILSGNAFAAEPVEMEPYANAFITSNSAEIIPTGGGDFYVQILIRGKYTMSQIGATRIKVFDEDGVEAFNVSYTTSGYSHIMAYNKSSHVTTASFSGDAGERYYAVVYFYVYCTNPAGAGSDVYTTTTVRV